MPILCPNCKSPVDPTEGVCGRGHRFPYRNGVLELTAEPFRSKLEAYLKTFEPYREKEGMRIKDPGIYPNLPFSKPLENDPSWRAKQMDWKVVHSFLRDLPGPKGLDYGAWNGWLSNRLSAEGLDMTAASYFVDPFDGLGAIQHYSNKFQAIQMNMEDPFILDETYDLIVINRGLSFFQDPLGLLRELKAKLNPGGILLATGLFFFRKLNKRMKFLESLKESYKSETGTELFLTQTSASLDWHDLKAFREGEWHLQAYRFWQYRGWFTRIFPERPFLCYGWYKNPEL
jgi:SAM-dependent methyltransferase